MIYTKDDYILKFQQLLSQKIIAGLKIYFFTYFRIV